MFQIKFSEQIFSSKLFVNFYAIFFFLNKKNNYNSIDQLSNPFLKEREKKSPRDALEFKKHIFFMFGLFAAQVFKKKNPRKEGYDATSQKP